MATTRLLGRWAVWKQIQGSHAVIRRWALQAGQQLMHQQISANLELQAATQQAQPAAHCQPSLCKAQAAQALPNLWANNFTKWPRDPTNMSKLTTHQKRHSAEKEQIFPRLCNKKWPRKSGSLMETPMFAACANQNKYVNWQSIGHLKFCGSCRSRVLERPPPHSKSLSADILCKHWQLNFPACGMSGSPSWQWVGWENGGKESLNCNQSPLCYGTGDQTGSSESFRAAREWHKPAAITNRMSYGHQEQIMRLKFRHNEKQKSMKLWPVVSWVAASKDRQGGFAPSPKGGMVFVCFLAPITTYVITIYLTALQDGYLCKWKGINTNFDKKAQKIVWKAIIYIYAVRLKRNGTGTSILGQ